MLSRSTLRELQEETERMEAERADLARRLAAIERRMEPLRAVLAMYAGEEEEGEGEEDVPTQAPKTIRNLLYEILREAGKPLHYRDLYKLILERGVTVGGQDPAKNVGAQLSNDERFKRHGGGLWGLAPSRRLDGSLPSASAPLPFPTFLPVKEQPSPAGAREFSEAPEDWEDEDEAEVTLNEEREDQALT